MTAGISKIEVFCIGMPLVGTFTSGGVSKNVTKCVVVRVTRNVVHPNRDRRRQLRGLGPGAGLELRHDLHLEARLLLHLAQDGLHRVLVRLDVAAGGQPHAEAVPVQRGTPVVGDEARDREVTLHVGGG